MKEITTKTGDEGFTSLRGGKRVPKSDLRIEVNGLLDHLNSHLGVVRSMMTDDNEEREFINKIQSELMVVMSHVATDDDDQNPRKLNVVEMTAQMEAHIMQSTTPRRFVLPGDFQLAAFIHLARTQCRNAERRMWELNQFHPVKPEIMAWLNRLSDYLFVLANETKE